MDHLNYDTLGSGDFQKLAEFIQGYSGIKMPSAKKTLVEGRLRRRVKALGMDTLSEYCRYLFDKGGLSHEAESVIDAVTTNKTEFFREAPHFRFLTEEALPQLTDGIRNGAPRMVKAWSAASSSGAEPYTIAMVLADFLGKKPGFDFTVHASDICSDVLRTAVRGIYPTEEIAPVPQPLLHRYFRRARDPAREEVRVAPELRQKVKFSRVNLMTEEYGLPKDLDIIFCRNVLIYFDHETQRRVVSHLCTHLRPGGFLFVGHTEALSGHGLPIRPISNAVFVLDKTQASPNRP